MKNYPDKFRVTPEESLFLAKKKGDECVYCGMRIGGRDITYPQTKTILMGVHVPSVRLEDIQAVLNLRDGWQYLLNSASEPLTFAYWCKLNEYITRNEAQGLSMLGTGCGRNAERAYMVPAQTEEQVRSQFSEILSSDTTATARALEAFVWGVQGQFFREGNRRTSMVLANKILISAGVGLLSIKDRHLERLNSLLMESCDTENREPVKDFLYENAIFGIM